MKLKFSKNWIKSKQPRKQRKYLANAPIHIRKRFIVSTFSEELRKKYTRRNFRLRKGDKVKIMKGQFKNRIGKVERINIKQRKIYIQGIENIRKDGTKAFYPIHPSNLMITELFLEDKKRKDALERKQNG
ncbi:MAG: 50S ribosomal protein L24 [Nanoarchaeota archaeon]|nr:50S ribosomal protein L24 [Nanoarchaeota archaeon]MBU1445020.1 50S ribosomal protein L24 [Nanoarchaeota archaeon]MBU2420030.1 50S ribosomal protein L24 [Nanoarchaeota archaeon]MBU2475490.1 50S ribosomal protein L24 [Nanoarchaeota archaeon]MBU3940545.1 50S ribosomal protein L24 [Nanoarchaeota archaeon]